LDWPPLKPSSRRYYSFRKRGAPDKAKEDIHFRFDRWFGVALEFELGVDFLWAAIAPTLNEIVQLAAIVIMQTTLNYFLQKGIAKATIEVKHSIYQKNNKRIRRGYQSHPAWF
jgi:uncharacterized membrane protein